MKLLGHTHAEINLSNIQYNIDEIKKLLPPATKMMAVVKANAYGHGAVEVSKAALRRGVNYLGVATLGEAMELREGEIDIPVLILSEMPPSVAEEVVRGGFSQTVYTFPFAQALSAAAVEFGKKIKIHIKIDTGMGRIGIRPEHALELIHKISSLANIEIEGIFTHLAKAEDTVGDYTKKQLRRFKTLLNTLEAEKIKIPLRHAANSAGTLFYPESHLDMVRVGLSMYGLYPPGATKKTCPGPGKKITLKPALAFKTRVVYLKKVPSGTSLSYGCTYTTPQETIIATLPVGYADGYSRRQSNSGEVLIKGKKFPVVGRVCMDLTMVNVGPNSQVRLGDEVVLIGTQNGKTISADELAEREETINYEVVCGIGKRVPRVYIT